MNRRVRMGALATPLAVAASAPAAGRVAWIPGQVGRLALTAASSVLVLFLLWEGLELGLARDDHTAHRMHYARGISSSLITALVVGALALRQHDLERQALEAEVAARTRDADEARSLLRLVVDATPASLVLLDADRRVVEANRLAASVHGAALAGLPCHQALLDRSTPCPECPVSGSGCIPQGGSPGVEHTDPRTGEVLEVEGHPVSLPDGRRFTLLVERIVTEQKKLEARIVHQEKMAAFGLLAAGIAHDMGNPLSSIVVQLQLLDDDALPAAAAPVIATVRHETARLQRILRELVDFARRRRDEAGLVSAQAVVEDALRILRHDRRMHRVRLHESYDREAAPVRLVEDHLMQVVLNLLINALDAMPEGGELRVEVRSAARRVAIRVHDTGVGMDRAVLARCFEPLFTTKPPGHGTGLGLSVSKDIVQAAGGTIEMHSAPGRGTTALVTLPEVPTTACSDAGVAAA